MRLLRIPEPFDGPQFQGIPWHPRALIWLLTVVAVASAGVLACRPSIDRVRADQLALAKLQAYVRAEGLDLKQFGRPEVAEQGGKWLYTYEYGGTPRQSVAVTVFSDGHVELGRMVEQSR
jgi:hypothetical protein